MAYVIGIDIGGTFTDGVAIDTDAERVITAKTPTTPRDPWAGVRDALEQLAEQVGGPVKELLAGTTKFAHGTTLTSNVLLERRGARVGLLATQGFGDSILMMSGKGRVAGLSLVERRHFRRTDKPEPIVPGELIVEVPERVDYRGSVVVPLRDEDVAAACDRLAELGVEAVAVALLWSFRNDEHERRLEQAVRERFDGAFVTRSSAVAPLLGEYERTATTVVNAYVGPAVASYLASVEQSLADAGLESPLLILQASGGVASAAETEPVNTIESGPAAGVIGSVHLLSQIGLDAAIATDVGGTTFKTTIIKGGEPSLTTETVLGQYSLLVPMVDVVSIGAGGGSIAWVDGGRLRVGPKSAGSDPGPACYGWGGEEPTVTDADLVLGYLNPDYFLGGRMKLSVEAAREAIRTRVADRLFDGDVIAAAAGIREIIDTQMADLIRKAGLERGHDPRDFAVLAYGGAGPVHCGAYAAELDAPKIVVPPDATVYSAFGAAVSDIHHTFQVSRQQPAPGELDAVREDFLDLERQAIEVLEREGLGGERIRLNAWAGMRYRRQFFELRIPVPTPASSLDEAALADVVRRFEAEYAKRYGESAKHGEDRVEYVRLGIDAVGLMQKPGLPPSALEGADASKARKGTRQVYWREAQGLVETPIYDGLALRPGNVVEGPAVLEHPGTAIAVHPGQTAAVDEYLNTVITLERGRDGSSRPSHL